MDFTLPEHIETLRIKTRDFVNQKIIPLESDVSSYDDHENINENLLSQKKYKKCKAIMNIHVLGNCSNIKKITIITVNL